MNLSNSQRVAKLTCDLFEHPGNIGRYLAHNIISRREPVELELPWFAYSAIDFLETYLRPEMRVFEFGSGGSTLFFARRCRSVVSIEDNARWRDIVAGKLSSRGVAHVDLRHVPVKFTNEQEFERSTYVSAVRQSRAHVIVVDGNEWTPNARPICFRAAEEQVAPGGIIIVDDSWRYQQLRNANRAQRFEIFESVGPARLGVTSTDVYFY
jgi:hypothetical protein